MDSSNEASPTLQPPIWIGDVPIASMKDNSRTLGLQFRGAGWYRQPQTHVLIDHTENPNFVRVMVWPLDPRPGLIAILALMDRTPYAVVGEIRRNWESVIELTRAIACEARTVPLDLWTHYRSQGLKTSLDGDIAPLQGAPPISIERGRFCHRDSSGGHYHIGSFTVEFIPHGSPLLAEIGPDNQLSKFLIIPEGMIGIALE